jgi:hypothetical protein
VFHPEIAHYLNILVGLSQPELFIYFDLEPPENVVFNGIFLGSYL